MTDEPTVPSLEIRPEEEPIGAELVRIAGSLAATPADAAKLLVLAAGTVLSSHYGPKRAARIFALLAENQDAAFRRMVQ